MIPWGIAVLMAGLVGWPAAVVADADEMSVGSELRAGIVTLGDGAVGRATDTGACLGVAVRASYATRDWYAYEFGVSWERLAQYAEYPLNGGRARRMRGWGWWRIEGGMVARLGVVWVPTLRVGLGVQGRRGTAAVFRDTRIQHVDGEPELELIATLGAGIEHRWSPAWVMGIRLDGQRSAWLGESAYRATTATLYVSSYWYP